MLNISNVEIIKTFLIVYVSWRVEIGFVGPIQKLLMVVITLTHHLLFTSLTGLWAPSRAHQPTIDCLVLLLKSMESFFL